MSLASRVRSAARILFAPASQRRGFDGARGGRLFADWFASATSADTEIRGSFQKLLARSRDLERNNDYQRAYLLSCERNVIGSGKYDLRMDCGEYKFTRGEPPKWVPDKLADSLIETAWSEWGKKGTCTVCGRYSWRDVKRLLVRATPRDGNFIARKIVGPRAGNRFNYALQLWEIDHLDVMKFVQFKGGGGIRFGIEYNADRRPVAYWMKVGHPGDIASGGYDNLQSVRFSAEEIYHVFIADRAEQSIGYPAIVSAITRLRQLGMFEEAAVVAARVGASKMGFFKTVPGANGEQGEFTGVDGAGRISMDASPGTFEDLPQGKELDSWDPAYPNIETGDFRKAMLRGVSASLGVSYNTLGNDLESVNFSSARVGLFEEREMWKMLQMFYAETFFEPVFKDWLESAILAGAINLPLGKFEKFNRPVFRQRRWAFIDPLKEVEAAKAAVDLRITSRRQFIEENGGDVEDVFHDAKADEDLAESIGLELEPEEESQPQYQKPMEKEDDEKADDEERQRETRERLRSLETRVPFQIVNNPPAVTVNNAAQPAPAAPNVTVNVPAQERAPAPVVNVQVPEQKRQELPTITVNVPAQPAPVVNVTVPPISATMTIARDSSGKIASAAIK